LLLFEVDLVSVWVSIVVLSNYWLAVAVVFVAYFVAVVYH
jgi:hypothetical protein